jgi:hypothetical protein
MGRSVQIEGTDKYMTAKRADFLVSRGIAEWINERTIRSDKLRRELADVSVSLARHPERVQSSFQGPIGHIRSSVNHQPEYFDRAKLLHWRESVLLRDGYKCVWCESTVKLEADHVKPKSVFPDLAYDIANGRTLCQACHRQTDTYGRKSSGISDVQSVA